MDPLLSRRGDLWIFTNTNTMCVYPFVASTILLVRWSPGYLEEASGWECLITSMDRIASPMRVGWRTPERWHSAPRRNDLIRYLVRAEDRLP